jgi:hypothetical protein
LGLPGREADALAAGDPVRRAFIESHLREAINSILENLSEAGHLAERAADETQRRGAR